MAGDKQTCKANRAYLGSFIGGSEGIGEGKGERGERKRGKRERGTDGEENKAEKRKEEAEFCLLKRPHSRQY